MITNEKFKFQYLIDPEVTLQLYHQITIPGNLYLFLT
jgi:hypothetical protein